MNRSLRSFLAHSRPYPVRPFHTPGRKYTTTYSVLPTLKCAGHFSSEYAPKPILPKTTVAVPLEFDEYRTYSETEQQPGGPLVLVHGFLGSKRNWSTLSKAFSKHLKRPVYALDLRNHGSSPHVDSMSYTDMAADVALFLKTHNLKDVTLLGHSLGGKVVMSAALNQETSKAISKLIVVDIAPISGKMSPEFAGYVEGMQKIVDSGITTRKEAIEVMKKYEQDPTLLTFLLTNAQQAPSSEQPKTLQFRIPLSVLAKALPDIGSFPYSPGEASWSGPTLVIKGSRSKFINHKNSHLFDQFFPNMQLVELDTTHWVHAERPAEFKDLVCRFIDDLDSKTR